MELYLPPPRLQYNPRNGQFLKGHITHNKGKKAKEYMSVEAIERMKKPLEIGRLLGNPNLPGANKIKIVGIKDGNWCVFASSVDAENKLGIQARNIRKCCKKERKTAGGIQWFYESSNEWLNQINK